MKEKELNVSVGFSEEKVPVGTHMCLIYTEEAERLDSLLKYVLSGLQNGERTACFSGKLQEADLREFLEENNISYDQHKQENALTLQGTEEVYFENGMFDPERMINTLSAFYEDSKKLGFTASRVIGEMIPEVEDMPGGDRLLEYEARVSMLLRKCPVTSVCQYDANSFDGATIMEILKVHPRMIVNGSVIHNPFYTLPEEYLSRIVNKRAKQ